MKARGLEMPKSNSSVDGVVEMNWAVLSGQKGAELVQEYSDLLQLHPTSELMEPFGLNFAKVFTRVFPTMCDAFRRLCLGQREWKYRVLEIGLMQMPEAKVFLQELKRVPKCCSGPLVDQVLSLLSEGEDDEQIQDFIDLFHSAILHMPATTVNVERLHASTQRNASCSKAGRFAETIHQNTYVLSTVLQHRRMKQAVESETLGATKIRAGRLLRERAARTTLPGRTRACKGRSKKSRGGSGSVMSLGPWKRFIFCNLFI